MTTEHSKKRASATKRGPGRYHQGGTPGNRIAKPRPVRAYAALMKAWASKRVTKAALRDANGAYTLVGGIYSIEGFPPDERSEFVLSAGQDADGEPFYTARRKWMAGVSAQRGY